MGSSTLPLSSICPSWEGSLIPAAFEALKRGIELERQRFKDKPFLVVSILHEFDYDGLWEAIEFIDGFGTQDDAIQCAIRSADAAKGDTLAKPGEGWHVVRPVWPDFFEDRTEHQGVRRVFYRRFKMKSESPFDSKYFEFEVVHVASREVVDQKLFEYYQAVESELQSYLIKRGEAPDGRWSQQECTSSVIVRHSGSPAAD